MDYPGSGKTTQIPVIIGLQKPDTGTVKLNDLEITEPGPTRGVSFQKPASLSHRLRKHRARRRSGSGVRPAGFDQRFRRAGNRGALASMISTARIVAMAQAA